MIYQYDQALPLPTKDLYDTQIMKMAVAAAKDMYDRGEKRIQDIYDKYGDFYSPIASDVDFVHNETVGKLQKAIDQMYANGEDPLRTADGRAKIAQLGRSINTAAIAKKKIRAKNAEEYYKNMGILKQKQLYNEAFSKYLKEDPNQWTDDFAGITSPTAYDDLNSHTTHWFDKINKDSYIRTDEEGYDWYGVKPSDLAEVMDQQMPDFINSDYGRFQLQLAKKQLGPMATDADAIEQVKRNIISANKEVTINPTRKLNPLKQLELNDQYKAREDARNHKYRVDEIALKHRLEHPEQYDEAGNLIASPVAQGPTPWNIQKETQMVGNFNSNMGVATSGTNVGIYDTQKFSSATKNIIDRLKSQLESLKEKYTTKIQDGFEEKEVEKKRFVPSGIGLTGQGRYETYKTKEQVPKYREQVDQKYYKHAKSIQAKINTYQKVLNGDFSEFNFAQFRDDFKNIAKSTKGAKTNEEMMKLADEFWSMFEVDASDVEDKERQRDAFAGSKATAEIPQLEGKYRPVSFERMNMNYTPVRRVNISGSMRFATEDDAKKQGKAVPFQTRFNKWLKKSGVTGYMIDDDIAHAVIPTPRGAQHDFAGKVSITGEDFKRFYDLIPSNEKSGWSENEVARLLGLVPRDRTGKKYDTNVGTWQKISYYDVPVTYTMEDPYEISQVNKKYSKDMYGAAKAYDMSVNDESAGFK